jgi:hypothetical protein
MMGIDRFSEERRAAASGSTRSTSDRLAFKVC